MPDWLAQFAAGLDSSEETTLAAVRAYAEWQQAHRHAEFTPSASDDVDIRTYLLQVRAAGADQQELQRVLSSLRRFYDWAAAQGLVDGNPFQKYNFDRPLLTREQIRRRQDTFKGEPREREIARLRALNALAEQLNRSLDAKSILDGALTILLQILGLETGWAFVRAEAGLADFLSADEPHDLVLAAAEHLPPGLEREDRRFLRQPPDCHCQSLLREGHLKRAVNIVECTRLRDSAWANGDNAGLLYHASVPLFLQGGGAGILNFATDEYQFLSAADLELLSTVGTQVSTALERARLYELTETQRQQLARELEMARAVQESLLPEKLPEIPGFRLAAHWWFAREVGGDFCDLFSAAEGKWGMVVADVSDKGAAAALYMTMTRGLLRSRAEAPSSPATLLQQVNHALCIQSTSSMFVTLFYAVLDAGSRELVYANAGHNPALLRHPDDRIEELRRTGMALGVLDGEAWHEQRLVFSPGDVLVIYTDGVTEAMDAHGEQYGEDRLKAAIASAPADAQALMDHLVHDVQSFVDPAPLTDDLTLLVVQCVGER